MRLLVCGSRTWTDIHALWEKLDEMAPDVVMQGCARGADVSAAAWARYHMVWLFGYRADWRTYGNAAGPIRNQRMLDEGRPDRCVAFNVGKELTRGTADMVRRCELAGIPVEIVTEGEA